MALTETPICDFGWKAFDFQLPATDGNIHTLDSIRGVSGTLIMFICNHCPYVKGITDRLPATIKALTELGIGVAAISSNDPEQYPEDSFDQMKTFADANKFNFPYLFDESQEVARAYDAVCTPDFFGFNMDLKLQYRGRLDSAGKNPVGPDTTPDLLDAMKLIAETGSGPRHQIASMGCSMKWR